MESVNSKIAAADELDAISEGLRGASVALVCAQESNTTSSSLYSLLIDVLDNYAERVAQVSKSIYYGPLNLVSSEGDATNE
ncbi:hypothetical protein DWW58_00780 [Olsenella sp. AF16-14LB]|jgi:hypothetical protein|uniref:hypothetical protein n=1 Tax=unclassified Olsenella TaxID=2638792 RepID=UPI000E4D41F1|nr:MULTISPECIES: hypothetical protein [unclassified Olsenella]RGU52490.1 hypothetical protein DWW58_00780 [Olsenella sp. AF16-14LB]RGU83732.1 hypothetical protein DWW44_00780 [Olsenella sp. AF15-43LB]